MSFPVEITSNIALPSGKFARPITLHDGLTVILGPNGAGKTQLMRGMKLSLQKIVAGKKGGLRFCGSDWAVGKLSIRL